MEIRQDPFLAFLHHHFADIWRTASDPDYQLSSKCDGPERDGQDCVDYPSMLGDACYSEHFDIL